MKKRWQSGRVKDYLISFSNAVAECGYTSSKEKLKYFVEGLHPEIRPFVYVCRPANMSRITLATNIRANVEAESRGASGSLTRTSKTNYKTYLLPTAEVSKKTPGTAESPTVWYGDLCLTSGDRPRLVRQGRE